MNNKKMTEENKIIDFLKKEGFAEVNAKEKQSPEFKRTIIQARSQMQSKKTVNYKSHFTCNNHPA